MTTTDRMTRADQQTEQARGVVAPDSLQDQTADRTLNDSLRRMIESLRADAVFGSPIEREGVTVIPCSEVMTGFGMGGGTGVSPAPASASQTEGGARPAGESRGGGVGGGGGGQGRPVAVVTISEGKVRVVPVFDATRLALALVTTAGIAAYTITQSLARAREARQRTAIRQAFMAAGVARAIRNAQRMGGQRMPAGFARAMRNRNARRGGAPLRMAITAAVVSRALQMARRRRRQEVQPTTNARGFRPPAFPRGFGRRVVRA